MHRTTPGFWSHFEQLPEPAKRVATRNFQRLKENPRHISLRFKRIGRYWSVRVGRSYRALAEEDGDDFIWVWIGSHANYNRMVGR